MADSVKAWEKIEGIKPSKRAYFAANRIAECIHGIEPGLYLIPQDIHGMAVIIDREMGTFKNTGETLTPVAEVRFMNLTPEAVQLAHQYVSVIEQQESGNFDNGYTPEELDRRRTRIHNKFLDAIRGCRIDTSHRASTTDLARRIVRWMPD